MNDSSSPDPSGDGSPARLPPPGRDFSPLDALVALVRERGLFVLVAGSIAALGIAYAVAAPAQYTTESAVVRESADAPTALSDALPSLSDLGLGTRESSSEAGLSPQSYPRILTSREVRLAVAQDTFFFPSTGRRTTLVAHVNRPPGPGEMLIDYTVRLPWTLKSWMDDAFENSGTARQDAHRRAAFRIAPTDEEQRAIDRLREQVTARTGESGSLSAGQGLMTISTTASDPDLSAQLNESFLLHLRERVQDLRTRRMEEQLGFVRRRFREARHDLARAEDSLAQFLERNRSVLAGGQVPALSFRRNRLERQVRFKEQLYSQLQEQRTQTRLQLQRRQPVLTVAEQPAPPPDPSGPNRTLIVLLSVLIGGAAGTLAVYLRSLRTATEESEDGRRKLAEIREGLTARGFVRSVRNELTSS